MPRDNVRGSASTILPRCAMSSTLSSICLTQLVSACTLEPFRTSLITMQENKMEQTQTIKPQPNAKTQKLAYEAPRAEFVPLQVEERLLSCLKALSNGLCWSGTLNS